ncbi:MAG: class I SAM-dependent methyltransferase [Clostridia bacterium]|nr:class I SAM-dependent methyltransferase [Clostridia bacterium]
MTDYDYIAAIYDEYTDGFDYSAYLDRIFKKAPYLPKKGLALDCGCGTGTLICELEKRGYSCTGVDISPEMLETASEKIEANGFEPHLVCQPLEKIDLYGAYDLCFCTLDTVNHLSANKLSAFFRRLINFTEPNGYFIFDAKTEAMMRKATRLRITDNEDSTLILDGRFADNRLTNYITVFLNEGEKYTRYDSIITENLYKRNDLRTVLKKSGFETVEVFAFKGRDVFIAQNKRIFA